MRSRAIFYCFMFLLSLGVGYSAGHIFVERADNGADTPLYRYALQGRVVALNLEERTVVLKVPHPYEDGATRQILLSVPTETMVGRSSVAKTDEGVLVYSAPIPSDFSKLTIGDRAFVLFHVSKGTVTANAMLYHSSLSPIP